MNIFYYATPIGKIGIGEENGKICVLSFHGKTLNGYEVETPILIEANRQLQEYFGGKRRDFDLPLAPKGTAFMQAVWNELRKIKFGTTASYKDIAEAVCNPKASRAVGMANNKNPIPIIIPCHRVIGANGKLVGYAGGLNIKEKLLRIEGVNTN